MAHRSDLTTIFSGQGMYYIVQIYLKIVVPHGEMGDIEVLVIALNGTGEDVCV